MAALDAPLVTQADLDAWKASYQKAQADRDASLAAAQKTGLSDYYVPLYGGDEIVPGMTQNILSNLGIENPYVPVYTLRGSANKGGSNANERMSFAALPNTEYRLVDKNTGDVITAKTPEEIKALTEAANALGQSGGKMANYAIESGQGGKFSTIYEDTPDIDKFNKIAGMAIPIAVSMIPGLQGVGAQMLLGAAGGAAGAAVAGNDPLKGALMGGLTSAGTQFLPKPLQSLGVGAKASKAIGAGLGATAGGIATGQPIDKALMSGALAGGTTYLGGELFGGNQPQDAGLKFNNPGDLAYGNTGAASAGLANNLNIIGQNAAAQLAAAGLPTSSFSVFSPSVSTSSGGSSSPTTSPRITVTGTPATSSAGSNFTVSPSVGTSPEIVATAQQKPPVSEDKSSFAVNDYGLLNPDIVATGDKGPAVKDTNELAVPIDVGGTLKGVTQPEVTDDIVVNAQKKDDVVPYVDPLTPRMDVTETLSDITKGPDTAKDTTADKISKYLRLAGLGVGLLGNIGSGSKTGSAGKYSSTKNLGSIFSAKLPKPGEGGAFTVGGLGGTAGTNAFTARPVTDWYRYGMGPAMDIPAGTDLSRATSPYAGYGPGTLGQDTFKAVTGMAHGGHLEYEDLTPEEKNFVDYHRRSLAVNPYKHDGDTTTVYGMINHANGGEMLHPGYIHGKMMDPEAAVNWAVRSGIDFPVYPDAKTAEERERAIHEDIITPDLQRYKKGDREFLKGYSHGGAHEGFAVEGPGTGRSDDIPAVLSDGEYVIDAETVALLGDGSSKAGAKKLDQMRVAIRKAKGKNLAKGKFSVNAKRPEAYMSGGRI